jgi:hypothetical protein
MGIWKHKGTLTPREPVVLINDPAYEDDSAGGELDPAYRSPWSGDLTVEVQIDAGCEMPQGSSDALIMCQDGGLPSVWVNDPSPRRLGHLIGPEARVVAEFVRVVHSGLGGTLARAVEAASAGTIQVCIPGQKVGR